MSTKPDLTGPGAAYVRVSTDQQDTERQYASIRTFLGTHGVTVPEGRWFEDHGPRDTADHRREFQRLIGQAEAGKVKWIVVDALDRFGTMDEFQLMAYLHRLRQAGCRLYDAGGTDWTRDGVANSIMAVFKGAESKEEQVKKSHRALGGHRTHAEDGEWQGGVSPFGLDKACFGRAAPVKELWRLVYEPGELVGRKPDKRGKLKAVYDLRRLKVYPDGRPPERYDGKGNVPLVEETQELRLVPSRDRAKIEAVVRTFKRWATESVRFSDLARALKRGGFRTAYGGDFQPVHIERMLKNPAYMGRYAYSRRHCGKFGRLAGGQIVPDQNYGEKDSDNDEADWVVSKRLLFDPLIDPEVWEKAQRKLRDRDSRPRAPGSPEEYLNGLLYCAGCGEQMHPGARDKKGGTRYQFYCSIYHTHCKTGRAADSGCRRNPVYQDEIQPYIKRWLEEAGSSWDLLMREVRDALKSGSPADNHEEQVDRYWKSFGEGVARITTYLAENHPEEYGAILSESERGRAEAEEAARDAAYQPPAPRGALKARYGKKLDEAVRRHANDPTVYHNLHPDQRDFVEAILACYRTNFDPAGIQAEIARLDAKHSDLTQRCLNLKDQRAIAKINAELAALSARMGELERQRDETAETVEAHYSEMLDLERKISAARAEFGHEGGDRNYRLLNQRLRDAIRRIVCKFEPTGEARRGRPTARLVEVTIEPVEGSAVSYYPESAAGGGNTPAGRSRSSGSRPRC